MRRPGAEQVFQWLLGLAIFAVLVGARHGLGPAAPGGAAAPAPAPSAAPPVANRYSGELGDFWVAPAGDNRGLLRCPTGYIIERQATAAVRSSELFFELDGHPPAAATLCQDRPVFVEIVGPQQNLRRSYYSTPGPVHVAVEAPLEHFRLLTVAGRPGIASMPDPGIGRQTAVLFVVERAPDTSEDAPGILLEMRVEGLPLGEIRSLAERIIIHGAG